MPTDATKKTVARVALWVAQIVLAAMFLFAGGSKLVGAPAMVNLFAENCSVIGRAQRGLEQSLRSCSTMPALPAPY